MCFDNQQFSVKCTRSNPSENIPLNENKIIEEIRNEYFHDSDTQSFKLRTVQYSNF